MSPYVLERSHTGMCQEYDTGHGEFTVIFGWWWLNSVLGINLGEGG